MIPNPFNRGRRLVKKPDMPSPADGTARPVFFERCPWWVGCGGMTPPFGTDAELADWLSQAGWCAVEVDGREWWACDDCSARKGLTPDEGE